VRAELTSAHFGTLSGYVCWARGANAGLRFEASAEAVMQVLKPLVPGMGRRDAAAITAPPAPEPSFLARIVRMTGARAARDPQFGAKAASTEK